MKTYEKPEVEFVELVSKEEIAGGIEGVPGIASSIF